MLDEPVSFKRGVCDKVSYYRPISLTSAGLVSKLLERTLSDKNLDYE